MKSNRTKMLGLLVVAVVGVVALVGCGQKPASEPTGAAGVAERTGAALDQAATSTKDLVGEGIEKVGEAVENAGEAVENAGEDM